jgi:hypothetical protein
MLPRIVSSAALRTAVIGSTRRVPTVVVRRAAATFLPAPVTRSLPSRTYVSSTKHTQAEYVNTVKKYGKVRFNGESVKNRVESNGCLLLIRFTCVLSHFLDIW